MTLTCIIIEDEPLAVSKLEGFIAKVPFIRLVNVYENPLQSIEFLKSNEVDIIFLDIQMEHLTGIDFLESVHVKSYVIITSAYAEYALKGYELNVFDYLLKPYSFERFMGSIDKVFNDIKEKQPEVAHNDNIFVKTEYRIENIALNDILYIEGMQGYLRIHLIDRRIMTKQNFKTILEKLPKERFMQVHKSWIVSIAKIESVERNRIKIGKQLIPVGETFKQSFYNIINRP